MLRVDNDAAIDSGCSCTSETCPEAKQSWREGLSIFTPSGPSSCVGLKLVMTGGQVLDSSHVLSQKRHKAMGVEEMGVEEYATRYTKSRGR